MTGDRSSVTAHVPAGGRRVRVRAVVSGRVQGVWYRESCRRQAEQLGVVGWVRNTPVGSVEIEAEGEPPAVEALLAWARRGPAQAEVDAVTVDDRPLVGESAFLVSG